MTGNLFTHNQPHNTDLSPLDPRCLGVGCDMRDNCRRCLQRETGKKPPAKTWNHHKEPECFFFTRETNKKKLNDEQKTNKILHR
jgi:hypothetical protein